MKKNDIIEALSKVIDCFDSLGLAYYIAGSVASSAYGMARATMDVDLVANIELSQVDHLVKSLKQDYYVSAETLADAVRRRASFNLIHLETMIKIDVFLAKDQPYDSQALARRRSDTLDQESSRKFYLSSPEDAVLGKLQWYQLGGGVSEQQWKDILGVLKVQSGKLDLEYLKYWASMLSVSELLSRAFDDAGIINQDK
jgi:hypothetical protein